MKRNSEQLKLRGYIDQVDLQKYRYKSKTELLTFLYSKKAVDRTCAATLLAEYLEKDVATALINRLKIEKKLYTKLAICETLSMGDEATIDLLTPNLGKIGSNQHKKLPKKPFEKKNYPLPRDIIARTLCRMDTKPLSALQVILLKGQRFQILEAVDAIGFISFYKNNEDLKQDIINLFDKYKDDELMMWELLRSLQAFSGQDVLDILKRYVDSESKPLAWESVRSIGQITRNKC